MITVRQYENKPYEIRNKKINGFCISTFMRSATANARPSNLDVDFTKSYLKVILHRGGEQYVLIQDNLKVLGLATNLTQASVRAFYQDHTYVTSLNLMAAGVFGEGLLSFDIDLKGTLDLRGDDLLVCELNIQSGFFSANVDANNAHLEFKERVSTGIERYVPKISSFIVQAGEMRRTFNIGNNVTSVILLNFDKSASWDPVIQNVVLASKQIDDTFSFRDLLTNKVNNLPIMPFQPADPGNENSYEFDQSYTLLENEDLDQVSLDIQYNPQNVTGNKNFIVVHSYYTDMKTLVEAEVKEQQARQEKLVELKQNQENAKIA